MPTFRGVLRGVLAGVTQTINVFTFHTDTGHVLTLDEFQDYLEALYDISFLAIIANAWSATSIAVTQADGSGGWDTLGERPFTIVGTSGDDNCPQQIAYVVVGITAGRARGKKFIAGVPEGMQENGVVDGVAMTQLNDYGGLYAGGISTGDGLLQCGTCDENGNNFHAFVGYRVNTIVGTQRRRKQGVGI